GRQLGNGHRRRVSATSDKAAGSASRPPFVMPRLQIARDDREAHRVDVHAAKPDPIPEDAFALRARLLGDALARQVFDGGDDLDALEPKLLESESGEQPRRGRRDPSAGGGGSYPVAEVRLQETDIQPVQPTSAEEA